MENPFKAAISSGENVIGLWLSLANAYSAEICATAGFQWLLIDGEHAPNDVRSTLAQLQAVAPYPAHPVVRTVDGNPALIKQMLDIGVQTLLIPMVDTAEQAIALAAATRYPPEGTRGVGAAAARASRWGGYKDYLETANDEVCLLVQAESRTALQNLEAICAVDGVHGVFIGPADLAASMGHRGHPEHPEVQQAIENAIRTIVASGKAAGTLTGDAKLARHYLELGASFVAVGLDLTLLARATRGLANEFGLGVISATPVSGASPY
ncbi:4-hydroxy-2-oxoheptanedioate aldolase [Pseudomonas fuscovaginae UPB0736]|uniref:4-hydroxy-2-oxoheptanedioate aldolase n=1 Tax=Pseudomonas asplenii TaxID=53407 RepID=UPI000289140E|nr:4-hydroxy-2-oxoheptanedioate aldolase [Pseudomonas fuscovaginae]UUQ65633.1 4-hydroxy-2-oxoheptanedioate aldolase [Pseudomonas fuscovaginae UPB0736]